MHRSNTAVMVNITEHPLTMEEQLAAMAAKLNRLEAENEKLRKQADSGPRSAIFNKAKPKMDHQLKSPPTRDIDFGKSDNERDSSGSEDEEYLYHSGDEDESFYCSTYTTSEAQTDPSRNEWLEGRMGEGDRYESLPERSVDRRRKQKEKRRNGRPADSWVE